MSEPRRYYIDDCRDERGFMRATDCLQSHEDTLRANSIEVIEAEPVLERIKQLETQLKEANEVAEFYGDEKNWMTTRKDELHEARMTIIQDPESFGQYDESWNVSTLLLIGGKRARQYIQKWKVGK